MSVEKFNSFVGLRPFESEESILFFGRQEQTVELLQRLHKNHFVGVVGSSGSGKSSLIRAGLIPGLKAGYLVNERDNWLISICKPGEGPLYNLAFALLSELQKDISLDAVNDCVQRIKEEGSDAIIELFQDVFNENRTNLFILIDQFEELFRFSMESKSSSARDEAIDFVNILLELAARAELPVYVVITMRSDFIGDCSQFYGLPEALNQSQYLVPRPTRAQLKNAIEGPVRLYGGKINPSLTSRLLNDVQNVRDELPLLQHVLMRIWDHEVRVDNNSELDLGDYYAVGGIEKALSLHADEAMAAMSDEEKQVAKLLFQSLTTTDDGGRKIRRPAHLTELLALTGVTREKILKIIDHFNSDGRAFLVVNASSNINDPLIDISHESLIRQWETLSGWVDEETGSARIYMRLSEAAALYKENKKDLINGTELQVAMDWRDMHCPNITWAGRYNDLYIETMAFLDNSSIKFEKDKKDQQKQIRRKKRSTGIVVGILCLLVLSSLATIYSFNLKNQATLSMEEARKERLNALEQTKLAQQQTDSAQAQRTIAQFESTRAKQAELFATQQRKLAQKSQEMALMQKNYSESSKMKAQQEYQQLLYKFNALTKELEEANKKVAKN